MYVGLMHKIILLDRTPVIYEWYMMAGFLVRVIKIGKCSSKTSKEVATRTHGERRLRCETQNPILYRAALLTSPVS